MCNKHNYFFPQKRLFRCFDVQLFSEFDKIQTTPSFGYIFPKVDNSVMLYLVTMPLSCGAFRSLLVFSYLLQTKSLFCAYCPSLLVDPGNFTNKYIFFKEDHFMKKPLEGIFVVEYSTYWVAPATAQWLRCLGARVIKVETGATGDSTRYFGRTCGMPITDDENPSFDMFNGGKEFVHLDFDKEEDMKVMHNMLEKADIFLSSIRLGGLKKRGLDYDSLKEKYPRLIMGHATGYGSEPGPMSELPGLDAVAFFGMNGLLRDLPLDEGHTPFCPPTGMGDTTTGMALFSGVMTALFNRERTGKGDYVATSLYGAGNWVTGPVNNGTQYFNPWPRSRGTQSPLGNAYLTKDGEYVQLFVNEYNKYFPVFCKAFGMEEYIGKPEYADRANINKNDFATCRELVARATEEAKKRTAKEILDVLQAGNVPCTRLRHIEDKYKEQEQLDQCLANGYIGDITYPSGKHYYQPQMPVFFKSLGVQNYARASRALGADNEAIIKEFN